jgi:Putative restriction endonuclease
LGLEITEAAFLPSAGVEAEINGGEFRKQNSGVRILKSVTGVMPDIAFHTREQESLFRETHIPVAPTWVAEILSAATAFYEVGRKFAKYEEYGVKEYRVLDPKILAHQFYTRRDNRLLKLGQGEEIFRSAAIPAFWVKRVWLDRQLRPNSTDKLPLDRRKLDSCRHLINLPSPLIPIKLRTSGETCRRMNCV